MGMKTAFLTYGPARTSPALKVAATAAYVIGGVLLVWSAYVHFHLWQSVGYRKIPTIGPLFLLQSIGGLALGLLVIAVRRVWAAILGVGFALSTMVGFFISVHHGLFGFKDSSAAPYAHEALIIEIATIAVLIVAGALCFARSASPTLTRTAPSKRASAGA